MNRPSKHQAIRQHEKSAEEKELYKNVCCKSASFRLVSDEGLWAQYLQPQLLSDA